MDANHVISLNIVTPDGQVYSQDVKRIIARATDGDLGILPNHFPIIATLKIAEVRTLRADDVNRKDNVANIVANSAELAANIDLRRARYAKQRAEAHIKQAVAKNDPDYRRRAEVALARAVNRIHVYNDR